MFKQLVVFSLLMVSVQTVFVAPAQGVLGVGDIVYDPAAFQRQLINYALSLDQYALQTEQYATQMQQLRNEYANLHNLGYQIDLSNLNQMQRVMASSIGISNDFAKMQGQFQELYPDFKTYQGQKSADYAKQSAEWSKRNHQNAYDILTVTTKLQESVARDQKTLKYLSDRSDSASGTKDLLQNMNQLLIMQTKQLMQLQQLISTTAKADAAYLAEKSSNGEAASSASKDLFRDWGKKGARTVKPNPGFLK
ncbi:P-type conjugative transfer protein TrbJ [Geomonas paludis]|uniref:P-type conjugative transfer protein TrbJ n=1 Tax=Geomonas paludis TaxID=2740185 RepID=A0ABY4LJ36_9BACT|nr:P-type conjugative transfer protein TrbJ [Geomonas paludis]UPU37872.1 P-type conjugative transfer protein TrbJ [Geomonas paludis]